MVAVLAVVRRVRRGPIFHLKSIHNLFDAFFQ